MKLTAQCGCGAVAVGMAVATLSQPLQQRDDASPSASPAILGEALGEALGDAAQLDEDVLDMVDHLMAWERADEASKALARLGVSKLATATTRHREAPPIGTVGQRCVVYVFT